MCETACQQCHDFTSKDSAENLDDVTAGLMQLKLYRTETHSQEKCVKSSKEAQSNNRKLAPSAAETTVADKNELQSRGTVINACQSDQPSVKNGELPNRGASENTDSSASDGCCRVTYRNRGPNGGKPTTYGNSKAGDATNSIGEQNQSASIVLSAGKRQDCDGFDHPIKFMKNVNVGLLEANSPGQMMPQMSPQSYAAAYNGHNINNGYNGGYADVNPSYMVHNVPNNNVTQQPFNNNCQYVPQQYAQAAVDLQCVNGAQVNYGPTVSNDVHFLHSNQMQMLQPQQLGFNNHSYADYNSYAQNGPASYAANQPMPMHHSVPSQFNFANNFAPNQAAFNSSGQQLANGQQLFMPATKSAQHPSPIQAHANQMPVMQQQFGALPTLTFDNLQMLNANGMLVLSSPNQLSSGSNIPVPVTALSNPSPSSSTHVAHSPGAPSPKNSNKNQAVGMPKHRDSKSLSLEAVAPSPGDSGYEESLSPKTPCNVGTPQTPDSVDASSLGSPQLPEPESFIIPDLESMLAQDGTTQATKRRSQQSKYEFSATEKELLECFQELKNEEEREASMRRARAQPYAATPANIQAVSFVPLPSGVLVVTMPSATSAQPAASTKTPRPILPKPRSDHVASMNSDLAAVAPKLPQSSAPLSSLQPATYIDCTITDDLDKLLTDVVDSLPDDDKLIDEVLLQDLLGDTAVSGPDLQLVTSTPASSNSNSSSINQQFVNSEYQLPSLGFTAAPSFTTMGGTGGGGVYNGAPLMPAGAAAAAGRGEMPAEKMKRCLVTVFKMTKEQMVYVDDDGDNNLHIVVCDRDNNVEMLQCLLQRACRENTIGQLINARNKNDRTPLLEAVCRRRVAMIRLLLAFGADVNVKSVSRSPSGEQIILSPVLLAAERGEPYVHTLAALLEAPSTNIDIRNHKDFTPLHVAVEAHGKTQQRLVINSAVTIQLLLSRGASFAARGGSSKTPLYCAVERKDLALLRFIIDLLPVEVRRDVVNIPMDSDQTCLHIAAGFSDAPPLAEHEAIVSLLLDCGANPRATIKRSLKSRPFECVSSSRPSIAALILSRCGNAGRSTNN